MSGLSQSWEEARLCRTPGPMGIHKGPDLSERPRLGASQPCTPGPNPGYGLQEASRGPNSSEPLNTRLSQPESSVPSNLTVKGSANSCAPPYCSGLCGDVCSKPHLPT